MVPQKKIFTVQNLVEKCKDAKALVLADYRGLTVEQLSELRRGLEKAGGELEVVKNRLLGRAAREAKLEIDPEALTGPTAVIWTWEDEIKPIKALAKFSQENGRPKIKLGFLGRQALSAERIEQLATLPGQEELRARLVGTLQAPAFGLINALNWNLGKLISILNAKCKMKNEK